MVHFQEINERHSIDFRGVCIRAVAKQEKFLHAQQCIPSLIVYYKSNEN